MGAEGAVSGAAGSAAVSSAGAAGAADAAGSSFTLWLGADGCAADAAVLSIWPAARRVFFFGVPVSFCLIPLALPPSCILTRPLAAESVSNSIFTSIVYTQPQAPVNVLRCLVRGVLWKFSTTADVPCGKRTRPPYYCIQKKKVPFRTGFLRFPLAVLTRVWYHDGHAAFAALRMC